MNVLIISDLHICNGDGFGAFHWDQDAFIEQLDRIKTRYHIDKTILNGDIFELCKYSYEEIARKHGRLVEYLQGRDTVYIKGNHDISHETARDHYVMVNGKGQKIRFEHGHNADIINGTIAGRFFSRLFFRILKVMVNCPFARSIYFSRLLKDEKASETGKFSSRKYKRYALRSLRDNDAIIMGHTHTMEAHAVHHPDKTKLYLNAGSCSLGRFQAIVLDTETLRYETIGLNPLKSRMPELNPRFVPQFA
jgi:predicted phosphodiesterase